MIIVGTLLWWSAIILASSAVLALVVVGSIISVMLAGDWLCRWPSPSWARGPRRREPIRIEGEDHGR